MTDTYRPNPQGKRLAELGAQRRAASGKEGWQPSELRPDSTEIPSPSFHQYVRFPQLTIG